jgi:hypothetical protein
MEWLVETHFHGNEYAQNSRSASGLYKEGLQGQSHKTEKNMIMGPRTKNDCAGEDQQQITRPDSSHQSGRHQAQKHR